MNKEEFRDWIYENYNVPGDNTTLAPDMLDGILEWAEGMSGEDRLRFFKTVFPDLPHQVLLQVFYRKEDNIMSYGQTIKELNKLIQFYKEDLLAGLSPAATITRAINELGVGTTLEVIAAAIKCKKHDGRISPRNLDYFMNIPSWEADEQYKILYGLDSIHPAHLEQMADELQKRNYMEQ